ncbi:hypothetical protein GQ600_10329 [Phytophthora cactorum]|nr:hypothetical protein GQ600_10329 [Phytophthora cactorum]
MMTILCMPLQIPQVISSEDARVKLILRRFIDGDAFLHLGSEISNYVGPTPTLSLHQACLMGSVQLLKCRQTPGWSPTHFLRSDPHYHRWEFICALTDAAGEGNSEEVKWLLAHFPACEAPSTVLDAAAMNGSCCFWSHTLCTQEATRLSPRRREK